MSYLFPNLIERLVLCAAGELLADIGFVMHLHESRLPSSTGSQWGHELKNLLARPSSFCFAQAVFTIHKLE